MQHTEKIVWCDEMGFPYTLFRDKISFIKYRTIQEKFYSLDDWLYVSDSDWQARFKDSTLHQEIYKEVSYDHIWNGDHCRIYCLDNEGTIIKQFRSYREASGWCKDMLDCFIYKGWVDNYRPYKSTGKIINEDREPVSLWDHHRPMTRPSAKFGEVFFSAYPRFYPRMKLPIYYDSPEKDSFFYLPSEEYFERHELHLKSKVFLS